MDRFYGMGNWQGESLWVSISGDASKGQHPPRARTVHPDIQEAKQIIKRLAWMSCSAKRQHTGYGSKDKL